MQPGTTGYGHCAGGTPAYRNARVAAHVRGLTALTAAGCQRLVSLFSSDPCSGALAQPSRVTHPAGSGSSGRSWCWRGSRH